MRTKACLAVTVMLLITNLFLALPVSADTFAISTNTGTVGTDVTINNICTYGTGEYTILWGVNQEPIKQGNATGCQSVTFTVPEAARGSHKILLKISGKTFEQNFTVLPSIKINNPEGLVDSNVTVIGHGFASNEGGIGILFDNEVVASGIIADAKGTWQGSFKVPQAASGEHTIDAAGVTPAGDVKDIKFKVKPKIDINPKAGQVGTMVTVEGNGFGASETNINIIYDDSVVKTGIVANSKGFWRSSFFVPPSTQGIHTITAYGSVSSPGTASSAVFALSPAVKVELTSGILGAPINVGDSIWVSGVGFQANESGIQITFDGNMLSSGITADAQGSWAIKTEVPLTTQGKHQITASGGNTRVEDVVPASIFISPSIRINPTSGSAGQEVALTASGFAANQKVIVSFNGNIVGTATSTDSRGSFNLGFSIPKGRGGKNIITATDATGNIAVANFEIENTPPATPSPISPEPGEKFGGVGPARITFAWSPVEDPSGVTYTLELSRSPDFAGIMMRKDGLTENEYTLKPEEALSNAEYFWRVKAVDGAMNESRWSDSQSIQVSSLEYHWLAVIVLAGLAIIGLIIWRIITLARRGWK